MARPVRTALFAWGLALILTPAGPAAANEARCVNASAEAAEAMRDARWADAIGILEVSVRRPACASMAASQRYSIAYATEQLGATDPARLCEAETLYREVLAAGADRDVATAARVRLKAVSGRCVTCDGAAADIAQNKWSRAEKRLRADIDRGGCAEHLPRLRFQLAEVVEQLAIDDPERACEARVLYDRAGESTRDVTQIRKAGRGAARMKLVCGARAAPPPPTPAPTPAPAPAPDRTAAWATTAAAAASVVVGGVLLATSQVYDADRNTARADFEAAHDANNPIALEAARTAFDDATDTAYGFNYAGWGMVGLGVGLAGVATWLWLDTPAVEVRGGPGQVQATIRF